MLNKKAIAATAAGVETDEDFNQTVLLLHGDGTNGAQNNTFTDSSTNNFTITRNGNTTQGTFSPFSPTGWSVYFDGTGDRLQTSTTSSDFEFTGDFTIEGWYFPTGSGLDCQPFGQAASGGGVQLYINANGSIEVAYNSATAFTTSSGAVVKGQWNHIALTRSGTTVRCMVNGSSVGSTTTSGTIGATTAFAIGARSGGGYESIGYISNVRVVDGTAVYTGSTYTVPTAPLTAITNTKLLACQDNRFIDVSSNAFTLTVSGNPSVQAFSPFAPTAAYSAATNGGSGYFDGTGDYLTTATSASGFSFGTGDFTIEFWVNSTQTSRCDPVGINASYSSSGWWGIVFNLDASGDMAWYENTNSRISASSTGWNNGAWNHVAITRSGNSVKMFLNGVQVGSTYTTSFTYGDSNVGIIVGTLQADPSSAYINSYISDLRIVKGTAVYTAAFTPPTAPLTAITNTSLLLNFTNAGIIDSTAKNVLETVGNAQIDTGTKKFGTGSLEFDGTGDSINAPNVPNLSFGSGDFTVEFWMYTSSTAADVISQRPSGNYGPFGIYIGGSQTIEGYVSTTGSSWVFTGSRSFTNNQWTHVALVRNGSTVYIYVDGTRSTGGNVSTSALMSDTSSPLRIGGTVGNGDFNGFIDDLRITKGVARYTANFTAPTKAFADQ